MPKVPTLTALKTAITKELKKNGFPQSTTMTTRVRGYRPRQKGFYYIDYYNNVSLVWCFGDTFVSAGKTSADMEVQIAKLYDCLAKTELVKYLDNKGTCMFLTNYSVEVDGKTFVMN